MTTRTGLNEIIFEVQAIAASVGEVWEADYLLKIIKVPPQRKNF